jgi:hypothetical protein
MPLFLGNIAGKKPDRSRIRDNLPEEGILTWDLNMRGHQ